MAPRRLQACGARLFGRIPPLLEWAAVTYGMNGILTRNDKILIACLVAVALLSAVPVVSAFARQVQGSRVYVTVGGRRVAAFSLATDRRLTIRTRAGMETLQVSRGKVRVANAPCPRKICRHGGWISRSGEELICVPGEMVIRIAGGGRDVDAVSR